ncbi:MAG: VWA domain-containing protein [Planctomycetota bacterium]|nr:MAG: VWA domain-containing protein [Planctomycetota bacterium]
MDFRYHEFDAEAAARRALLQRLRRLFHRLLLQTNGDVDEALRWLDLLAQRHALYGPSLSIADVKKLLEDEAAVKRTPRGLELTRKGERSLRKESFEAIFTSLGKDAAGDHRVPAAGAGLERLPETRPYTFGDSVSLIDSNATLTNAIRRGGVDRIEIREEDLEVHETEHLSSCASVLLIDISHSMILYGEDRITPAKQVAMALTELIQSRYPKDSIQVVTFGDEAREVPLDSLPYMGVGPFHTNTRAALQLARELLRKKRQVNRQILMITDGKPSAITERNGTIFKNPFGLDRRIVAKTIDEAVACRRLGIPITTFMLTEDPTLVAFVEEFTEANRGRAYYSRPDRLGSFLFVDYIRNRRRSVR